MGRYLSWLANAILLVFCCFLVADTANAVFAAMLEPPPAAAVPREAAVASDTRSWNDRQVILARNLFDASLLSPAPEVIEEDEEDLEATKLPLTLLGTVSSPNPELAWAAVRDDEKREHLVLRVDDPVKGGKALVVRIERRRIVLSENGALRELALEETPVVGTPAPESRARTAARSRSRRTATARARNVRNRASGPTAPAALGGRSPARLLQGADIQARYDEDGTMSGLQVGSLEAGSFLEQAGLRDGDVIKVVNGIEFTGLDDTPRMFMELAEAEELSIRVERADGSQDTIDVSLPPE